MASDLIPSSRSGSQSPNPDKELRNDAAALAYATINVESITKKAEPAMKLLRRYREEEESDNAPGKVSTPRISLGNI